MITKPTVLVLGAGASVPYDYPAGRGLKKLVVEALRSQKSDKVDILRCNLELPRPRKEIAEFGKALHESRIESVDAFLECEGNREDVEIGKRAIAQVLGARERPDVLVNTTIDKGGWYTWLFERMADCPFEQFGENALTVITFNYDRSWEQFLYTNFRALHRREDPDAAISQLRSLPVIHLHGHLGLLRWQGGDAPNYGEYLSGPSQPEFVVQKMARKIKILHEADKADDEFKLAHQALREARRVYFIGFGYGQKNLERLFPPEVVQALVKHGVNPDGTSYEFDPVDRSRVHQHLQRGEFITDKHQLQKTVAFLKERGTLD